MNTIQAVTLQKEISRLFYAKKINAIKNLYRVITTNYKLDLSDNDIYDNKNRVESWSDERATTSFEPAFDGEYTYLLQCNNVPCHQVDYNNLEETDSIGATDCEFEGECLVLPEMKMKVITEANDTDFEEMGYYTVELELI